MNSDEFNEYVANAQYAISSQKVELAKEYYEKAHKLRPDDAEVLNKLGIELFCDQNQKNS